MREKSPARCMKETIRLEDYAGMITSALPKGILLNTFQDKFNTMVIGWGALGTVWAKPSFTIYVRQSRYSKKALDETGEFTISIPTGAPDAEINRICGSLSGRDTDKEKEAGLTLESAQTISVPGIRQYPLTLECKILYAQAQDLSAIPEEIVGRMYPVTDHGRDPHTAYIGQIVSAYLIK